MAPPKNPKSDKTLNQQAVTQLRPEDMVDVWQNGRSKRLLVTAIIDYIRDQMSEAMTLMSPAAHTHPISDVTTLIAQLAAFVTALAGKAPINHAHNIGDILQNFVDATTYPAVHYNGAYPATAKATVAGGNAVFQFTQDGTPGGAPIFAGGPLPNSELFRAEEGTNPHAFGTAVWSNGNKTLTVPVSRNGATLSVLGLTVLGANVPANGSVIFATAWGR